MNENFSLYIAEEGIGGGMVRILNSSEVFSERDLIATYLDQRNGCLGMPGTIRPDQVRILILGGMLMGTGHHHEMLMDWAVKPF